MSIMSVPPHVIDFIACALEEDIGHGDVTTDSIIAPAAKCKAVVVSKQDAVIAGLNFFREVFRQVDPSIKIFSKVRDSAQVKKGAVLCTLSGPAGSILKGERVALNIVQRLCAVATITYQLVELTKGYPAKVVDTRKTTPCMRYMEKYAVRMGGGYNHRFGLYDGILIKDNHIKSAGNIKKAMKKIKDVNHLLSVEVEVKNLKEVKEALDAGVEIIMLDNMTPPVMKKAVALIKRTKSSVLVEASGNVSAANIRDIAATGVDLISVGALTHSAPACDLSLKIL